MHDENGIVPANIPEEYRWNGTIILVKVLFSFLKSAFSRHDNVRASSTLFIWLNENVPLTAPNGFSFYNYVE